MTLWATLCGNHNNKCPAVGETSVVVTAGDATLVGRSAAQSRLTPPAAVVSHPMFRKKVAACMTFQRLCSDNYYQCSNHSTQCHNIPNRNGRQTTYRTTGLRSSRRNQRSSAYQSPRIAALRRVSQPKRLRATIFNERENASAART